MPRKGRAGVLGAAAARENVLKTVWAAARCAAQHTCSGVKRRAAPCCTRSPARVPFCSQHAHTQYTRYAEGDPDIKPAEFSRFVYNITPWSYRVSRHMFQQLAMTKTKQVGIGSFDTV